MWSLPVTKLSETVNGLPVLKKADPGINQRLPYRGADVFKGRWLSGLKHGLKIRPDDQDIIHIHLHWRGNEGCRGQAEHVQQRTGAGHVR